MFHFSEIAGQLIEAQGAIQAKDEEDLAFHAERLLSDERARRELGEKGHQFLLKKGTGKDV
jgi:3-deoxy-D-manno-octulosonic-acid transferase